MSACWKQATSKKNAAKGSQSYLKLDYGWKTDGHMVVVLFIKKAIEQIPQDDNEVQFMKRRVNLTNWSKGLYPLKKEPTGITVNDRIIGLDPVPKLIDTRVHRQHGSTEPYEEAWGNNIHVASNAKLGNTASHHDQQIDSKILSYTRSEKCSSGLPQQKEETTI
ncbi:hypothetical protein RMATCC62417_02179 [Rhizopus microsporus]|nr:hypothetical protein RMATCC62417_02179 [Rhizopus microsporus]